MMSNLRILIVEDEAVTAADLHDELVGCGYKVVGTADTTEDALRQAEETKPDLVLMDIKLAGVHDGVVAACAMRGLQIPVVFLTAHYDKQTLARAQKTRPVGYLTKPYESHDLTIAIEVGFACHRSEVERARLSRELHAERARVGILSALLSVCPGCQKIRNAEGHWVDLEDFLIAQGAAISPNPHCPECEHRVLQDLPPAPDES